MRKHVKRYFSILLAALLFAAPLAPPIFAQSPAEAKSAVLGYIARTVKSPAFGDEWFVLAQARGGVTNAPYYNDYYTRAESYVKGRGAVLSATRSTENARLILALSAIGKSAAHVGGYDLTAPFSDMEWVTAQGVNGPANALLALDSGGYGSAELREELLGYILDNESEGGGWAAAAQFSASEDYTAMALQALAAYREDTRAAAAVDRGVALLSALQNANGSFGFEAEGANTESTAQVIIALTALDIDPAADPRFVKAGGNPVSALLACQLADGGFGHRPGDARADGMATEQAARALVAYDRFARGEASLYENMYEPHAHSYGEWLTRTAVTCTAPGVEYRACGQCLTAELTQTVTPPGHDEISEITPPTKRAGGYTTHTCSRCGNVRTDSHTEKIKRSEGFTFWDWIKFIVFFGWIWME
ncbi:MAG: terpene cyclase/mutase family protein [Oscillospiraceae bacterium]|nr:terpene cyclase/mutase family protein [Oscillospiraceae bacterium]